MAYAEVDTKVEFINLQIKCSNLLEFYSKKFNSKVREFLNFILECCKLDSVKGIGSDKLSSLIELDELDRNKSKEVFGSITIFMTTILACRENFTDELK